MAEEESRKSAGQITKNCLKDPAKIPAAGKSQQGLTEQICTKQLRSSMNGQYRLNLRFLGGKVIDAVN
ncbi:hypothetical protein ACSFC1_03805 [Pseudothermotoga sp. U03pept]|uniref:hypothetical protein n=1 Tax=Pseudothermotoga sp. U03pept TaxID=3447012 RepID=UPI003F02F04E